MPGPNDGQWTDEGGRIKAGPGHLSQPRSHEVVDTVGSPSFWHKTHRVLNLQLSLVVYNLPNL